MTQPMPQDQMVHMITGYWISQMVYVAARLSIADLLADGPRTAEELAGMTGTHARSLYRLLRALASVGVFSEDGEGRFRQTPLGECLRSDVSGSQSAMALMMGQEHLHCWNDLLESVRTGQTAFDRLYGKPIFEYLGEHPEQARIFDAAMTAIHGRETQWALDAYDFSGIHVLADIGGGNASNLIAILEHYPEMRGILFDLPHVVDRARASIEAAGIADRCETVGGSFFDAIPVQADAYFLRNIIHDWDDEKSGLILRNIGRSMSPGARLLVVQHVLPPGDAPSYGKLLDLTMFLLPGGLERTEAEFRRIYEGSGFRLTRIVPIRGDLSIIEGQRG